MHRGSWRLSLSISKASFFPYLKEAAAPVREATGRITGCWAGGHVVFLSTGLGNSLVWVLVEVWDSVCRGRSSVGQKTHFSCGAARGNSCFGHSQYYGGAGLLECFDSQSLFLFSPSHFAFYTFTSPSPFSFLPPLSSSLLPLAPAQIITSVLFISFTTLILFLAWTSVLSLPVYSVSSLSHIFTPYIFFLACPHTHIIHFPSRRTSVPAQLPYSPHIPNKKF